LARIALDVMGGDYAPRAPIAGALLALTELDATHRIQLVGQRQVVTAELDALLRGECAAAATQRERWELVDASDVIAMTDKPSVAVRGKPNSSMVVGLRLQAEGRSDAFVSAGNTGAQMAASKEILKLHPGLRRPAIGTVFPTARKPVVVIDSGANVDCSGDELVQFARLGAVYAEDFLERTSPSIGLLSVGEEPEKGNKAVKDAHKLLLGAGLNFQGNVEGRDVIAGASERGPIDVVVCDGFVGNVLLKFYESVPALMSELLLRHGFDQAALRAAFATLDYAERGGAPLLGVCGVSIISHGKSSERAMKNAIKVAVRAVETQLSPHIGHRLAASEASGESPTTPARQAAADRSH
jgi:glycerol-3-phosphate acyltransferase PlsX